MAEAAASPITLALIDDYDVVVVGLAHMFEDFTDRVEILELDASTPLKSTVDIALYDAFAQSEVAHDVAALIESRRASKVVIYTWNFHPDAIDSAFAMGVDGYLSKTLTAKELVDALERIHAGEKVCSPAPPDAESADGVQWPGRDQGLTEREAEIIALITQGKSNAEIAAVLFLSINSIKSAIRTAYRKIGVTTRVEAVLWGVEHGFKPDYHRIEFWASSSAS